MSYRHLAAPRTGQKLQVTTEVHKVIFLKVLSTTTTRISSLTVPAVLAEQTTYQRGRGKQIS